MYIPMTKAAERMGVGSAAVARHALQREGIELEPLGRRFYAVSEDDLETYIAKHGVRTKKGRPSGSRSRDDGRPEGGAHE